jgi:hypothetical protein
LNAPAWRLQGADGDAATPNPFPYSELDVVMVAVVLRLHHFLGVQQPVLDVGNEHIAVDELPVDSRHLGQSWLVGQQRRRLVAVDNLEWRGVE